jgi:hypothetical protein
VRTLFADFKGIDLDPDLGRYNPLGTEECNTQLRRLAEGERVLLNEPKNCKPRGEW